MKLKISSKLIVLSPLLVFFILFLGSGFYFTLLGREYAFYQVSSSVAILPAIILAFFLSKDSFQETIMIFLEGVRNHNIIMMSLIYLLAGAFASVLQNVGGVTNTANFALNFVPNEASLPALFLISTMVSMAMGTSMGTIATMGPIGVGIAHSIGIPLPLTMGVVVSGAMFGDNLSMISDTTIAAIQIHGCSLKDKFISNAIMAFPAMILTLVVLMLIGLFNTHDMRALPAGEYQLLQSLPYVLVLILALLGKNVFIVLILGIFSAGIIGLTTIPDYTFVTISKNIFDGYKEMTEILILSLLMGGLGELIKHQGGFVFIINQLNRFLFSKDTINQKGAECAISAIASLSDICTANNTAAIILSGEATKEIAGIHRISPARVATLVDLFTCAIQGLLPYSAQILMAGSLSGLSPLSIIPHVHFCFFLGFAGLAAIFWQFPRFTLIKEIKEPCLT